jgi:hypothetical protein
MYFLKSDIIDNATRNKQFELSWVCIVQYCSKISIDIMYVVHLHSFDPPLGFESSKYCKGK